MNMSYKHIFSLLLIIASFDNLRAQDFIVGFDTTSIPEVSVGEVIISASRDRIRLREMPVSVSCLSEKDIKVNNIGNLTDITSLVANFFMPDYGSKLTSPVYIRGVGSRIDAPSVGLYVDGVPYFEKASFNTDFFDIQRIEVLRGPQGTLYGRNTMGGIINIVTLSPLQYQGTNIGLSAGTYGNYNANAGYYARPGEKFGYSVSANLIHNDGFFTNEYDGSKADRMNSAGLRSRLAWTPGKKVTVENIASIEWSDQGGYPYSILNDTTGKAEPVNYNDSSRYLRKLFSDAVVAHLNTKTAEIISTTSYQYLNDFQAIDQDFTPSSLYYVTQAQNQNMLSQEIIARSSSGSGYKWLTGIYGFGQWLDKNVDVNAYSAGTITYKSYDHMIYGAAIFHQSTLSDFLTPGLSLTGGIRLDFERDILQYGYDMLKNDLLTNLADTIYPSMSSLQLLPRLALTYIKGRQSFYGVVAKGYKTGGYNSTFERAEDLTYEPEHSWNYEIGVKSSLGNRVYAEAALFYIDWRNQQIYQTVPSGRGSMLKNAGHSVSKGAEFTLKAEPFHGLEASVSYGYTFATFLSHIVNETTDYSGNYIPYVPKHTVALQASHSIVFAKPALIDRIRLSLLAKGAGPVYWNEANSHSQAFYSTIDAKISFIKGVMQLGIWGRNITGTNYEAFYFTALNHQYVQVGKPARFGVELSLKF